MGSRRVTVKCTECGATHRVLESRLGQERPCPKCGVNFELDEESTRSTYDLNVSLPKGGHVQDEAQSAAPNIAAAWDDEDFSPDPPAAPRDEPASGTPMLKRGIHRESESSPSRRGGSGKVSLNYPLLITVGLVLSLLLGLLVHLLTRPGDGDAPPAPAAENADDESTE